MNSFVDVIDLWPNDAQLARDVGRSRGTISEWRSSNHIPPIRFDDMIAAAERRGFEGVTFAALSAIAKTKTPA